MEPEHFLPCESESEASSHTLSEGKEEKAPDALTIKVSGGCHNSGFGSVSEVDGDRKTEYKSTPEDEESDEDEDEKVNTLVGTNSLWFSQSRLKSIISLARVNTNFTLVVKNKVLDYSYNIGNYCSSLVNASSQQGTFTEDVKVINFAPAVIIFANTCVSFSLTPAWLLMPRCQCNTVLAWLHLQILLTMRSHENSCSPVNPVLFKVWWAFALYCFCMIFNFPAKLDPLNSYQVSY